jgi:hypothetical protein
LFFCRGRKYYDSYISFSPNALVRISREVRGWTLHHRNDKSLEELAATYNPVIRGWIGYYGNFYRTQLRPTLKRIDLYVIRWVRRKFKRLVHHRYRAQGAASAAAILNFEQCFYPKDEAAAYTESAVRRDCGEVQRVDGYHQDRPHPYARRYPPSRSNRNYLERSVRISRSTLSCLLHSKVYGTYHAGAAFSVACRTR